MAVVIEAKDREAKLLGKGAPYRDVNLFIEAGAGAGKTFFIASKVVDQLLQGIPPERFVVITFTNKAVEEMTGRIVRVLNDRLKELADQTDTESKAAYATLKKASECLYKMNVSTIHSFCNKILNEHCFQADLSYGSALLDEDQELARQDRLFFQWYRSLPPQDFDAIENCGEDKPLSILLNSYHALCDYFDDTVIEASIVPSFSLKTVNQQLMDAYNEMLSLANLFTGGLLSSAGAKFDEAMRKDSRLPQLLKAAVVPSDLEERSLLIGVWSKVNSLIVPKKDDVPKALKKDFDNAKQALKDMATDLMQIRNDVCAYLDAYSKVAINKYAIQAWEYMKANRDRETLSNNQLIYETFRFLKKAGMYDLIAKDYDVIYIDEFQDTDKCQIEFVIDLAKHIDERKVREGKLSTSLVVVGDPKQSIYRFRGADFNSFMDAKNSFELANPPAPADPRYVSVYFPDNFRSNHFVIGYVNQAFSVYPFCSGYAYSPMAVVPKNQIQTTDTDPKIIDGVYSYPFKSGGDPAHSLAKFIVYLVENHYLLHKVYSHWVNKKEEWEIKLEPVNYSDFLILCKGKKTMSDYVDALNEMGVSTRISGSFDLSSSSILRRVHRFLAYLLCDDEGRRRIAETVRQEDLRDGNGLATLEEMRNLTLDMAPMAKVVYFYQNLDLVLSAFRLPDATTYRSCTQQIIEALGMSSCQNGPETLEAIEALLHTEQKSQINLDPDENCVTLMNVHQSKGLEGNIVILLDEGGELTSQPAYQVNGKVYLNNIKFFEAEKEISVRENAEELYRLEYVAATRAKYALIFESEFTQGHGHLFARDGFAFDLSAGFLAPFSYPGSTLPDVADVENLSAPKQESAEVKATIKKVGFTANPSPIYETSPSSLETHAPVNGEDKAVYRRPKGKEFGTCFHRLMQLHFLRPKASLKTLAEQAVKESAILPEEKDGYIDALVECAVGATSLLEVQPFYASATRIVPECEFYHFDETKYGKTPTLMNGSIDLLLEGEEEAIIIDYKTDVQVEERREAFEARLKETYSRQIHAYVQATKAASGKANVRGYLLYLEEKEKETVGHLLKID